jgi:hypothetical protein
MDQWAFVIAAYTIAAAGTGLASLLGWRAMRAAEADAETMSDRA